jgi:Pre-mRNA 3'-end-processing endonuclease polyadenylation factor C-term
VMGAVDVKQAAENELALEWDSSAANDMIADSILAVITEIDKSPASVKCMIPCSCICLCIAHNLISVSSDGWRAEAST